MAKHTTVTLVDDLDGSKAEEQVQFSVDGRSYEIDLSSKNATKLRDGLAPYVSAARRGGRTASASASSNGSSASERAVNRAVREWAVAQGMKISERGRIPSSVLEAYHSAH
ncbi:MAG: Lsr2 family protein [Pseudonocardia sp.]|nr:Lsr2 family protein [Pseudonocardia sp.]